MTRRRFDGNSTEFGLWLRDQRELDSDLGFRATNLDFIWRNQQQNKWLMIEEKRFMAEPKPCQLEAFWLVASCALTDATYYGFHLLVFEKTSPEDGLMWLNRTPITKPVLLDFLTFKYPRHRYLAVDLFSKRKVL